MKHILTLYLFILFISNLNASDIKELYFDVEARNEKIPIKVYLKADSKSAPLIVYSHGLGGSRETKKYLLEHWTEAGFICVSCQSVASLRIQSR